MILVQTIRCLSEVSGGNVKSVSRAFVEKMGRVKNSVVVPVSYLSLCQVYLANY